MRAVSIVGYKKSGKTSLGVSLCQNLTEKGYKVAAVKFAHHSFDKAESDTQRYLQYSASVAGLTENESCIFWSDKKYLPDLVPLMDAEVLIIEGGKHIEYVPRIIVPETEEDIQELNPDLALAVWGDVKTDMPTVNDVNVLSDYVLKNGFFLPGLDCGTCGRENCGQLAREIVAGQASISDCKAVQKEFEVKVNGQSLALNPFVRSIICGAIEGMLSNLKGYAPGNIDIHMEI